MYPGLPSASVTQIRDAGEEAGIIVLKKYARSGDLVILDFSGMGPDAADQMEIQ